MGDSGSGAHRPGGRSDGRSGWRSHACVVRYMKKAITIAYRVFTLQVHNAGAAEIC
jgi:hypothetical protein